MPAILQPEQLTLAVLAGGKGRRLGGRAKGLLTAGGTPFVERVLALGTLCQQALIISADPAYDRFGALRIEDVEPGRGAPGGVVTALLAARTAWVLVVACDMPFVTVEAARTLLAADDAEVRCFAREGELEPLFAVYSAALGPPWRARLKDNPSLRALLAERRVRVFDAVDPRCLQSVNTPAQLAAVKS